MDKIAKNKGREVKFLEGPHLYTLDDGRNLTSVTTLLKGCFPEFETDRIAEAYARKHGRQKEEVIEEWEHKNKVAVDFGTKIHLMAEMLLKGESEDKITKLIETEKDKLYYDSVLRYYHEHFLKRYELVEPEKLVFSVQYEIAGTMDILVKEKATGKMVVLDWKTNKVIEKYNSFNQMGLGPVKHLDDTNFFHYALQLNIYEHLLQTEYDDFKNMQFDRRILHITDEKVLTYCVPDLKTEIKEILQLHQLKKAA